MLRRLWIGPALAVALAVAGPASAISISAPTITNNTTNAFNGGGGTGLSGDKNAISGTQVLASDATSFATRFWLTGAADVGAGGNTRGVTTTASYTITFSVTQTAAAPFELLIDTSLLGALTTIDDAVGLGGNGGLADLRVGNVTGSFSGGAPTSGSLGLASLAELAGGGGTNNLVINQAGNAVLSGIGTGAAQSFSLTFGFVARANSTCSGFCVSGGDEKAFRLGLSTATGGGALTSGVSADDYAGVGSRNGLADGHFVTLTAIPEPGTALLLGLGLAGLVRYGSRKAA